MERELKAARLDARDVRAELDALRAPRETLLRAPSRQATRAPARAGLDDRRAWRSRRAAMLERLEGLRTALLAIPERPEPLTALAARALGAARQDLAFVLRRGGRRRTSTSWRRAGRGVFLRATPIDVSARLKELLFDQVRAAVLTSATLAVDGGFELPEGAARHRADGRAAAGLALRLPASRPCSTCRGGMPEPLVAVVRATGRRRRSCASSS